MQFGCFIWLLIVNNLSRVLVFESHSLETIAEMRNYFLIPFLGEPAISTFVDCYLRGSVIRDDTSILLTAGFLLPGFCSPEPAVPPILRLSLPDSCLKTWIKACTKVSRRLQMVSHLLVSDGREDQERALALFHVMTLAPPLDFGNDACVSIGLGRCRCPLY
jgi:hypothetical protein